VRRRLVVVAAAAAFIALSVVVARWLQADNAERSRVQALLSAQARGDASAMARELEECDAACRAAVDGLARRLRRPGEVNIVRFDSRTAHALGAETGTTRVVWTAGEGLPTVQCVLVRRTGTALSGPAVSLLRLSAPIGRQAGC
jgi:sensor domain CHASE-containing protein